MMSKKIKLFNNEIEMGLRILVILSSVYPKSFDPGISEWGNPI
jgi:hypothetical protein